LGSAQYPCKFWRGSGACNLRQQWSYTVRAVCFFHYRCEWLYEFAPNRTRSNYADSHFDAVVAFSILEHLQCDQLSSAMREVARVLEAGGSFLIGCPAVHPAMNAAFAAIGFSDIEHHHFSSIVDVLRAAEPHFELRRRATLSRALDWVLPLGWAPYTAALLRKRS